MGDVESAARARAAATAGYDFLDERMPGWDRSILRVDQGNARHCALGQTCGKYDAGRERFKLNTQQVIGLGFCKLTPTSGYEQLTTAWNDLLDERRALRYGSGRTPIDTHKRVLQPV